MATVVGNPKEPAAELVDVFQSRQGLEGSEENILGQVFCIEVIAALVVGDVVDGLLVALDEQLKAFEIPLE